MAVFEVPLSPQPQRFSIALANVSYRMTVRWIDDVDGGWVLDIADSSDAPIVSGIPLITGADLLAQYGYLGFGGELGVQTDTDLDAVPTYTNLGVTSHLYFLTS